MSIFDSSPVVPLTQENPVIPQIPTPKPLAESDFELICRLIGSELSPWYYNPLVAQLKAINEYVKHVSHEQMPLDNPEVDNSHEYIPTKPDGSIDFGAWEDLENARAAEEFEATGRRIKVRDFYACEKMEDDWY